MPDMDYSVIDVAGNYSVSRRVLLAGAFAAPAVAGRNGPAHAAGAAATAAGRSHPHFDPGLARRLQQVLRDALADPNTHAPGAILHVQGPRLGAWTGVAGLGRVTPDVPMHPRDRFRAGSIMKPFVSVVVLQLAERGRLSLDARLPEVLPANVVARFPTAPEVTVRMLLGHRSGIPEWDLAAQDEYIPHHPEKVWTIKEILDLAASHPPVFEPGTNYQYSNTDYNLLGLIIERITRRSWRHEVTRRVIDPLGLARTSLPAPGDRSIKGAHAHGYAEVDGRLTDLTSVDPSMAGAAGGGALVTTVQDLARFLDALLGGRLFRHRETLEQMLAFAPAPDEGGQVGYGLGIELREAPGGVELIGHLGSTAGYCSYIGRLHPQDVTMTFDLNWQTDPTPLFLPAVQALTATPL
jgi:D-alanyl-D-alanine carboxypeptidase